MKQKIAPSLTFALLLFIGANCGTENPMRETNDTAAIENATGAFSGNVELIEGETLTLRILKDGQLLAHIEFAKGSVKQTSGNGDLAQANLSASTLADIGTYHLKETEPGDYTLQISAKGYQTQTLNVTVVPDQRVAVDKVVLVALETPVSHLRGLLSDASTGEPIGAVTLHLHRVEGKVDETLTTANGVFTFENLPIDTGWILTIAHTGYERQDIAVPPIPAEETVELQIHLTRLPEAEKLPPGQGLSLGSQAPLFELPDSDGKVHTLADSLSNGHVVLIFYRGGW